MLPYAGTMDDHGLARLRVGAFAALSADEAKVTVSDLLDGKLRISARSEHLGRSVVVLVETSAAPLPPRDRAILELAARGLPGKVVALELGISSSTVSASLGRTLETIGVRSRGELVTLAALGHARLEPVTDDAPAWTTVVRGLARLTLTERTAIIASFSLMDAERMQHLTPAECDVVRAVLAGKTNAEIARSRRTSPSTVANQLAQVYRKLKIGSRWALASCR